MLKKSSVLVLEVSLTPQRAFSQPLHLSRKRQLMLFMHGSHTSQARSTTIISLWLQCQRNES